MCSFFFLETKFEPIKKVEPEVPLEPIRRERREVAIDNEDKNKKQLEFSNLEKSESKVLQLKEIKQLLDKDYEVGSLFLPFFV